jgi:hypothetical protein
MRISKKIDGRVKNSRPKYNDRALLKVPVTVHITGQKMDKLGGKEKVRDLIKNFLSRL